LETTTAALHNGSAPT